MEGLESDGGLGPLLPHRRAQLAAEDAAAAHSRYAAVTQPLLSRCALIGRWARAPNRRLLVLGLPRDRGPIPRAHLRPLPIIPLAPLLYKTT